MFRDLPSTFQGVLRVRGGGLFAVDLRGQVVSSGLTVAPAASSSSSTGSSSSSSSSGACAGGACTGCCHQVPPSGCDQGAGCHHARSGGGGLLGPTSPSPMRGPGGFGVVCDRRPPHARVARRRRPYVWAGLVCNRRPPFAPRPPPPTARGLVPTWSRHCYGKTQMKSIP